jgi:two-component system chemotaxis sensor kinase CheA
MGGSLSDIKQQLLGTFLEESADGLEQLEAGLLRLEAGFDAAVIDDVFRAAHSIKGGAGTFGFSGVTELAHVMESLLDQMRAGTLAPAPALMALLLEGVDALRGSLASVRDGRPIDVVAQGPLRQRLHEAGTHAQAAAALPVTASAAPAVPEQRGWRIQFRPHPQLLGLGNEPWRLVRELEQLGVVTVAADLAALPALAAIAPATCYLAWRITVEGVVARAAVDEVFSWVADDCDLTIDSLTPPGQGTTAAASPASSNAPSTPVLSSAPARAPARPSAPEEGEVAIASLRVGIDKIDSLMNMVGELVITQSMLGGLDDGGPLDEHRLARVREGLSQLARNSRALQESVMRLRSVPVSVVFNRFPRLVHDLSRQLGKHVELVINGQSTELDKTVLEKLGDPLVHLVRNSLDHAFEMPEERARAGKPETGRLSLSAFHRGADIIIEVEDDGRGLDQERILRKARERAIIAADAELSPSEIAALIFAPGFSTAESVTDLSGRGVGMDVVRRNVRSLGGDIAVDSVRGMGTKITLCLPLTLAIIDGQLVRAGDHPYVVPLLSIVESVLIDGARIKAVAGGGTVYRVRDQLVPVFDLARLLRGNGGLEAHEGLQGRLLVLVEADGRRLGLIVDELQAQQQVVIKSLESNFGRVEGLSGATILGDGNVAFILDMAGLGRLSKTSHGHAAPVVSATSGANTATAAANREVSRAAEAS